ncbi:hypothetical protein Lpp37_13619 [Lacticaseibacillus paracasei subsp. paracasei Lpp37]|nr:hypothetical protein Lpp37_13619 [Lacticaseibacillus paracasei subsp. paracasei Lpp37]
MYSLYPLLKVVSGISLHPGKTIAELETAVSDLKGKKKVSDVVSGATFTDTSGYLTAIISAAKAAK